MGKKEKKAGRPLLKSSGSSIVFHFFGLEFYHRK
jgi:hypothetical protein